MGHTLILGVGNLLMSDDGLGVHVLRRLETEAARLPETVQLVDGGTAGLELLGYLEGVSRLIIVDAVKAGDQPGTLVRLTGEAVPAYLSLKISPHEVALPDMLMTAKLRDLYPPEVVVWGIQPASLALGTDLSPEVAAQLDKLVEKVIAEAVND
jgi:hydrogenase maturation protease